MRSEIERLAGAHTAPLAPLGVAGYLWTASSGLHNLMDVLEQIAAGTRCTFTLPPREPRQPRIPAAPAAPATS